MSGKKKVFNNKNEMAGGQLFGPWNKPKKTLIFDNWNLKKIALLPLWAKINFVKVEKHLFKPTYCISSANCLIFKIAFHKQKYQSYLYLFEHNISLHFNVCFTKTHYPPSI